MKNYQELIVVSWLQMGYRHSDHQTSVYSLENAIPVLGITKRLNDNVEALACQSRNFYLRQFQSVVRL